MNITYTFTLKNNQINKDGTQSILFRIICNRKPFYINTNIRVFKKHWEKNKAFIKNSHPFAQMLNIQLDAFPKSLNKFLSTRTVNEESYTIEEIKKLFKEKPISPSSCFYDYIEKMLNTEGKASLQSTTLLLHRQQLKGLRDYAPFLTFNQINREFLTTYENHLKFKLKNTVNTIHLKLKFIRTYINKAIRDEIITDYVFKRYKLKTEETKPKFLSMKDFKKLEGYYLTTKSEIHKKHLQYFLFACVSGLRYSDLKALKWSAVKNNWLIFHSEKTKCAINIPINAIVKKYLPVQSDSEYIFDVPKNQAANGFLKEIQIANEIPHKITTHVARHTFATLCLNMDFPLPVVQKLLGHKSMKTTEIYAKIIDKKLETEMQKWDNY